jgi:PPIC-type peptidyl-prolyl cis-trans isomerase-like protein
MQRSRRCGCLIGLGAAALLACREPAREAPKLSQVQSAITQLAAVESAHAAAEPSGVPPADTQPGAYPPARWRLAPTASLAPCVLWVSHLLIRHEGVPEGRAAFDRLPLPWTPEPAPPARTRQRALALAQALGQQAQLHPARFSELVRTHSEDVTTRLSGGSLGAISAATLRSWPAVLDALAALGPGEVSRPVETEFGVHLLQRRDPVPEQTVSGRRLVIGYDEAPWLRAHLAGRDIPRRSRAEAEALAMQLFERARREPSRFGELIAEYSDHQDSLRGGDFGQWSSRERTPFPREIERLASLEVGVIAPPLDTFLGFQIIQRVANRPRPEQAFARIQWTVDAGAPKGSPRSPGEAWARLEQMAQLLQTHPERFEEYQAASCCKDGVHQWQEGRESVLTERLLAPLQIGQISATPVKLSRTQYAILQRREPAPPTPPDVCIQLPAPKQPDVPAFVLSTGRLEPLRRAQQAAARELGLEEETRARLEKLHDLEPAWRAARSPAERSALLEALNANVTELLGAEPAARYRRHLAEQVERALLQPGPSPWP